MGTDKARLLVEGRVLAEYVADVMTQVVAPVLEVGPGVTELRAVAERPIGAGPLAAVAAGWEALQALGDPVAVLVLACDLPLVTVGLLELLATWPGDSSVVPVVAGRAQPLCARWSRGALTESRGRLVHDSTLAHLVDSAETIVIDESVWGSLVDPRVFEDVDRPEDLGRLGLSWRAGAERPVT